MKSWAIDYTCKLEDGLEEERRFTLSAMNIREALDMATAHVQDQIDNDDIIDAVIWDVGIIDDNVWLE